MKRCALLLTILLSTFSLAEKPKQPTEAELAAITARGRLMAEYDVAAWHATDAVQAAAKGDLSTKVHGFYVAQKGDKGWTVVFGGVSDKQDKYLISYEAVQGSTPTEFTVNRYDPPREDAGYYLASAKALAIAMKDFGRPNRPYNTYVLPEKEGKFYVYLLPAQTTDGIYPLGGDVRYLFSADGTTILEKRQMHKTVLEFDYRPGNKDVDVKTVKAGYHTHVLSNTPEDSDVFFVLSRKPSIPEYVGMLDKTIYVILTDGTILLGK